MAIQSMEKPSRPFKQVIIWGHKLHTHTHSYIHFAFKRAFEALGYPTYWFDNNDNVRNFDFSNSLFLTEGQVDQKIPLRSDCRYILHYCRDFSKYKKLYDQGNCILLAVYRYDNPEAGGRHYLMTAPQCEKVDRWTYIDVPEKIIYMPWATDLLPNEIDLVKEKIKSVKKEKAVHVVASIDGGGKENPFENLSKYAPFRQACEGNGIAFYNHKYLSMEENIDVTQRSLIASALQSQIQCDIGYIPCRIFKNISYGQFGSTNSKEVWELFDRKIVYNPDTYQLFYDTVNKVQHMDISELYELMDYVRDNHTYINRIERILWFMNKIKPFNT